MKLDGDVVQRLRAAVQRTLFRVVRAPDVIRVEEMADEGRAEVTFPPPDGSLCIEWAIQKNVFGFLKDAQNADGAFFVLTGDDAAEAHVVECKRTITQDSWSKAKLQMRSTLLRLRALGGVLGVEITKVIGYTAYCDDELDPDRSPDPSITKISVGDEPPAPEDAEDAGAVRNQFDWGSEVAHLRGFSEPLTHRKLKLQMSDGVGRGSFRLST